ncbi:hypothetical protein DDE19_26050 [Micromonospora ureilytica]|uniref:Uncharacterized protein n=1 Tax=Micromonospora ureilytica TaxID=709868 RepID=A0A3N9XJZ4_9ACTN|nr:hypothetical protein [Micromonospora ureilytica]RQX13405.1 hypothetical protein DDE19_26050 [Micromonospora ureilytica]
MRDGHRVTVKALTAMPGVADGAVLHNVEWGPRLATLVDAGRYEVLEGGATEPTATEPVATAAASGIEPVATTATGGEESDDAGEATTAAAAAGDGPRRTRRR